MLSDLVFVLRHIKEILEKYNLSDLYTNFANTLEQISQASTDDLQKALMDYKKSIKETHDSFEKFSLSYSQLEIIKRFGASAVLGKAGYQSFLDALSENSANTPGAIQEIRKQGEAIAKLLANITTVLSGLGGIADIQKEPIPTGNKAIELVFENDVAVKTIEDLRNRSGDWYLITHAAKLLDPKFPVDIQIKMMSKGSPLLVELCGSYIQIAAVGGIFFLCLQLYERVLKIAKLHLEISKLGKEDEKERLELEEALRKKEETMKKEEIEVIVGQVMEKYALVLSQTAKNSAKIALRTATGRMFDFVNGGGEVRYRDGEPDPKSEATKIELPDIEKLAGEVKELKDYVEVQRQLEAESKKERVGTSEFLVKEVEVKVPRKKNWPKKKAPREETQTEK